MKKLLILTILITTYLQAEEETAEKQSMCIGDAEKIYELGIYPCKKGDVFKEWGSGMPISDAVKICEPGTITSGTGNFGKRDIIYTCILRAEEDFLDDIWHFEHHNRYKKKKKKK